MVRRLIIVVLALAILFGGLFGWKFVQIRQSASQAHGEPPAVVAVVEPRLEQWRPYLEAVGSLVASQGVEVAAEVAGQVTRVELESGKRTAAGDPLVQLDATVDQAELAGLEAEARLTDLQFQRVQRLYNDRTVSRSELDQARAALDAARANAATQRALADKKTIRAPFTGLLGIRSVDVGEYLAAGDPVVTLVALDPIHADYAIPERHFAQVAIDRPVEVQVPAYPEQQFDGTITALNAAVEQGTRSIRARATLPNPEGRLRPGMFAQVRTLLPQAPPVLTLPRTAIAYAPYGDSVFVVERQGTALVARRRPVTTGEVREGRVAILEGLATGDRVVVGGQVKLRNDQPVVVDDDAPLTGAAP